MAQSNEDGPIHRGASPRVSGLADRRVKDALAVNDGSPCPKTTEGYRAPLPDGTRVRVLKSWGYAEAGNVYVSRHDGRNTSLWDEEHGMIVLCLYGPDCFRQLKEGEVWVIEPQCEPGA